MSTQRKKDIGLLHVLSGLCLETMEWCALWRCKQRQESLFDQHRSSTNWRRRETNVRQGERCVSAHYIIDSHLLLSLPSRQTDIDDAAREQQLRNDVVAAQLCDGVHENSNNNHSIYMMMSVVIWSRFLLSQRCVQQH